MSDDRVACTLAAQQRRRPRCRDRCRPRRRLWRRTRRRTRRPRRPPLRRPRRRLRRRVGYRVGHELGDGLGRRRFRRLWARVRGCTLGTDLNVGAVPKGFRVAPGRVGGDVHHLEDAVVAGDTRRQLVAQGVVGRRRRIGHDPAVRVVPRVRAFSAAGAARAVGDARRFREAHFVGEQSLALRVHVVGVAAVAPVVRRVRGPRRRRDDARIRARGELRRGVRGVELEHVLVEAILRQRRAVSAEAELEPAEVVRRHPDVDVDRFARFVKRRGRRIPTRNARARREHAAATVVAAEAVPARQCDRLARRAAADARVQRREVRHRRGKDDRRVAVRALRLGVDGDVVDDLAARRREQVRVPFGGCGDHREERAGAGHAAASAAGVRGASVRGVRGAAGVRAVAVRLVLVCL